MLNNPNLEKDIVGDTYFSRKLSGYKSFKLKNSFEINTTTLENDSNNVEFHRQGSIRSLFESDNKSIEDQPFLSKYFGSIDTRTQESEIENVISNFISYSGIISDYKKQKLNITNLNFPFKPSLNIKFFNLSPIADVETIGVKDYQKLLTNLNLSKNYISNIVDNPLLESDDSEAINKFIESFDNLIKKYSCKQKLEKLKETIYSSIVENINDYSKRSFDKSTEIEKKATAYKKEKNDFCETISNFVIVANRYKKNNLCIPDKISVNNIEKQYDKYRFVSKVKKNEIKEEDIRQMLVSPIKNFDDFSKVKDMGFEEIGKRLNADTVKLPYGSLTEKYKQACLEYSKVNWFQKEKGSILQSDSSIISGNSAGLNAQYYLDLFTLLEKKKLFIVDQPEDDVSEVRISKELKTIMRRMAEREQIIFVTHNAELVVNLDVDNVIVFKNDDGGKLLIRNGALEYEDEEINILNEVAELLDGGAEVIRKRWKRYEKNRD